MFLHITRAHEQGQICIYGFRSKVCPKKSSSEFPGLISSFTAHYYPHPGSNVKIHFESSKPNKDIYSLSVPLESLVLKKRHFQESQLTAEWSRRDPGENPGKGVLWRFAAPQITRLDIFRGTWYVWDSDFNAGIRSFASFDAPST